MSENYEICILLNHLETLLHHRNQFCWLWCEKYTTPQQTTICSGACVPGHGVVCISKYTRLVHFPIGACVSHAHYNDVIMGAIASQITTLKIVFSTVYSDADQRKHQRSASLAFVWGIPRGPVNSPQKWPVTRKMFPFGDVIMRRFFLNRHSFPGRKVSSSTFKWRILIQISQNSLPKVNIYEGLVRNRRQDIISTNNEWWPSSLTTFFTMPELHSMMTSSNGNIFRVTGNLCGEFTGPRWIPRTKASDAELWCFLWSASE